MADSNASPIKLISNNNIIFVTGNGFDLACGLKTKYSDFLDDLTTNKCYCNADLSQLLRDKDYNAIFDLYIKNKDLSLWELYLLDIYQSKKINGDTWIDLENEIEKTFSKNDIWTNVYEQISMLVKYIGYPSICSLRPDHYDETFSLVLLNRYNKDLIKKSSGDRKTFNEDNFVLVMKKELMLLEKKFSNYLMSLKLDDCGYYDVREQNLNTILKLFENGKTLRLCTFNYTGAAKDTSLNNSLIYHGLNGLHGSIENPIFGIDNIDSPYGNLEDLSKASRRRNAHLPTYYDLYSDPNRNKYNIAFFGVSFGTNDYDDFRILFEYLGGDDSVIILYSNFNNDSDCLENLYRSVRKMYIDLHIARNESDFYKMTQNGKVIFYEIPVGDLKKISTSEETKGDSAPKSEDK